MEKCKSEQTFTFAVPISMAEEFERYASRRGQTMSSMLRALMYDFIEEEKKGGSILPA